MNSKQQIIHNAPSTKHCAIHWGRSFSTSSSFYRWKSGFKTVGSSGGSKTCICRYIAIISKPESFFEKSCQKVGDFAWKPLQCCDTVSVFHYVFAIECLQNVKLTNKYKFRPNFANKNVALWTMLRFVRLQCWGKCTANKCLKTSTSSSTTFTSSSPIAAK